MTIALEICELRKAFGPLEIIQGLALDVKQGERHAIIGPNGAGKSTLFNLVSGRLRRSSGTVKLNGIDISERSPQEIARLGLGRSFQITNIFPRLSVFENVRNALLWSSGERYVFWRSIETSRGLRERAETLIESIGLAGRRKQPAGVLTYAEQRALELGLTIAGGATVILLDEPTAGMSRAETERAIELIRDVTRNRTLVVIEHDMSVVFGLSDRISVLAYGRVIATDTPENIRSNKAVQEAYLGSVPN